MEGTQLTELILQIVLAIVGIAATVIGAWLAKGQREVQESKKVRDYAEGIKNFNPVLWDLLWAVAGAAVKRIEDEADEFAYGDAYDQVKREALEFARRYAELTGVKTGDLLTPENLDKLIRYVLEETTQSYKKTIKDLQQPAQPEPIRAAFTELKQSEPIKADLTDRAMDEIKGYIERRFASPLEADDPR